MIDDIKLNLEKEAQQLGIELDKNGKIQYKYELLSKSDLANGVCDAIEAGDEKKRSQYYAALMLRYWFKIYKWKEDSSSCGLLEIEDYVEWLEEALDIVFRQHGCDAWRKPTGNLYGDPNGPDKVINRCCFSVRGLYYQYYNKDKRKIHYGGNCDSIERQIEAYGDAADALNMGTMENERLNGVDLIIKHLIQEDKLKEAIILDGIAYQDSFKTTKSKINYKDTEGNNSSYTQYSNEFNPRKLVSYLKKLDDNFIKYFINKYSQSYGLDEEIKINAENLRKMSSQKLYVYINKTIQEVKSNSSLIGEIS